MILICSSQFFFHICDRWRNNVGVRVLRVLFFWQYLRIFLPSVSHVTPTSFAASTACSKEFHYLTAQFWDVFLFFGGTLPPDLSLAPQWFCSTFPHPLSSFLFPWSPIPSLWSFFLLFSVLHRVLLQYGEDRRNRTIGKHSSSFFRWFLSSRIWRWIWTQWFRELIMTDVSSLGYLKINDQKWLLVP